MTDSRDAMISLTVLWVSVCTVSCAVPAIQNKGLHMPPVCFTLSVPKSTYMDFHNYTFKSCFRWAEVLLCSAIGLVWLRHQSMVSDGYGLCIRVFFCSFIFSYRVNGSRSSCLEALLVERGRRPLDACLTPRTSFCSCLSSSAASPSHEVLLLPVVQIAHDYWFFSKVSLTTWLLSGNAGSAESLMESVTTPVRLRMDFHLYSFAGSHVAKWHWAEKSIKWNVFVIHLVELLMSSSALIRAN